MTGHLLVWVLGALGLAAGVPAARWLRQVTYRKPDEEELPLPGGRWWVVPVTGVTFAVLAWRVVVAEPASTSDPGVGSGREGWVQAVLLVTLLLVALACVCLAAMDFDVHRLPDRIMWPTMGTLVGGYALAALVAGEPGVWLRVLLAGLVCGTGYLLLALLSLARGSLALGLGDVKLAALLGAALGWFGWPTVLVGMYAGFLVGGVFALWLLVAGKVKLRGGDLAYGPPMMVGAVIGAVLAPGTLGSLF
jgi:leader peptidase (prepilin peptidase) / N-methyltransferase